MPWIEKGDVIGIKASGLALWVSYKSVTSTCIHNCLELDGDVAREHQMYFDRYKSPRDSEFYDAAGEYLKTH